MTVAFASSRVRVGEQSRETRARSFMADSGEAHQDGQASGVPSSGASISRKVVEDCCRVVVRDLGRIRNTDVFRTLQDLPAMKRLMRKDSVRFSEGPGGYELFQEAYELDVGGLCKETSPDKFVDHVKRRRYPAAERLLKKLEARFWEVAGRDAEPCWWNICGLRGFWYRETFAPPSGRLVVFVEMAVEFERRPLRDDLWYYDMEDDPC